MPSHEWTFGIEEEYFLVHARSGELVRRVPAKLLARAQARLGEVVVPELLQCQLEAASPVFASSAEARERLPALRRELAEVVGAAGYRLVAAGTHPLAGWHGQTVTAKPRYAELVEDFQIIGRRNVLCGMHVHAAVPAGVDRVALMNRLMPWLPLLLALSASSPFWGGLPTGLMSYRQAAYDEWPRTGIPDPFPDQRAYDAFVRRLVRQGAIPDASNLWWAIRPSLRLPTLELRICDVCPRSADALALAALYRCLVRLHVRRPALGAGFDPAGRRLIDENRWRAKRWGVAASFLAAKGRGPVPARALFERLRRLIGPDIAALDCAPEIEHCATILAEGTAADAQLAVYQRARAQGAGRHGAVRRVVDWLADATVAGAQSRR
ncbi:carboxylate-amine ligase [Arenimonas composti]|uniref:Putative glutamate--cysteine ligase 2 n=1 Tax=Arenimonas composti TR7-09 = DSM 18010 TaxID=1121013 RepID=A0A091B9T4_9GAMM|nr:carboxylate-amine ligase [Arenimonas composti]KFN48262.1 hypothetical protein P873_01515 [Arenimonas composti TR7-09 = DSM 18010]